MLKSKASRWLAGPYLVWMALFIVVPLFIVIWYAMTTADGQFTLDNLTQIGRYSSVFARSLILAAVSTVICLVLAFPVGYFLSRLRANKQHIMLMLVMLPMWMNFLLRTYAWMTLLEKNGLINRFFGLFGLGPFNMINTSGAVVLGMVYNYLPFMILPIYGHCHRHHPGVRAVGVHLHHQPHAGRWFQPAHRRPDRTAVPGQLLQPESGFRHEPGTHGHRAAVHELYLQLR